MLAREALAVSALHVAEVVDAEPSLEVVEQKADLGLGPHADDAYAHRLARREHRPERLFEARVLEVVERDGVDHELVRPQLLVHADHELRARRVAQAVRAEHRQVIRLPRIAGVVPIANVDHAHVIRLLRARPGQKLRHRTAGWIGTEQALRFLTPDVQLVR